LPRSANATLPLHVVLDNYGTQKHPEARQWLAEPANQRITLHFTPTGCTWLNMVEIFGIITRQAIRRGTFTSVKDLTTAVDASTPTTTAASPLLGPRRRRTAHQNQTVKELTPRDTRTTEASGTPVVLA
jgi:hypothetical protein